MRLVVPERSVLPLDRVSDVLDPFAATLVRATIESLTDHLMDAHTQGPEATFEDLYRWYVITLVSG